MKQVRQATRAVAEAAAYLAVRLEVGVDNGDEALHSAGTHVYVRLAARLLGIVQDCMEGYAPLAPPTAEVAARHAALLGELAELQQAIAELRPQVAGDLGVLCDAADVCLQAAEGTVPAIDGYEATD